MGRLASKPPPCTLLNPGPGGGIGRRRGLKPPSPPGGVWVRVPPRAPKDANSRQHNHPSTPQPPFQSGRTGIDFPIWFPFCILGSNIGIVIETPFGPAAPEVPLPRSPLAFVVAQVRFERVASIGSENFIAGFQEEIRSAYPLMRREQQAGVLVSSDGQITTAESGHLWQFNERPEGWQVTLAPDFVALSTNRYTRRHDFLDRLKEVLVVAQRELGVRYCERLGIRYVDRVTDPGLLARLRELVRPEVLGTVAADPGVEGVHLVHGFADTIYQLPDRVEMHGRWGLLPPNATFDPAIAPADSPGAGFSTLMLIPVSRWLSTQLRSRHARHQPANASTASSAGQCRMSSSSHTGVGRDTYSGDIDNLAPSRRPVGRNRARPRTAC